MGFGRPSTVTDNLTDSKMAVTSWARYGTLQVILPCGTHQEGSLGGPCFIVQVGRHKRAASICPEPVLASVSTVLAS